MCQVTKNSSDLRQLVLVCVFGTERSLLAASDRTVRTFINLLRGSAIVNFPRFRKGAHTYNWNRERKFVMFPGGSFDFGRLIKVL